MMEEGEGQQQDQPAAASGQGQTGLTGLETDLTGLQLAAEVSQGISHPLPFLSS
jgi:hypothetical protein